MARLVIEFEGRSVGIQQAIDQISKKLDGLETNTKKTTRAVSNSFNKLESNFKKSAANIARSATRLSATLGTVLAGGGFAIATKNAIEFETAITNVGTLLGDSLPLLKDYNAGVREIAKSTSKGLVDLTAGLYDAISAGVGDTKDAGQALEFLNQAQKAAVAGLATTKEAVNAGTTAINVFGFEAAESEQFFDKFFQTVRDGKTTFAELSSSFGNVATAAKASNVSFEETLAGITQLTKGGIATAEATTALRSLFQSLAAPTIRARKRIDELNESLAAQGKTLRVEFGQQAVESQGLVKVLSNLRKATGGNLEELRRLIPTVEGLQAALILAKNDGSDFANEIDNITGASGTLGEAFELQRQTIGFQIGQLRSQFQSLSATVFQEVQPAIAEALEAVRESLSEVDVDDLVSGVKALGSVVAGAVKFLIEFGDIIAVAFGGLALSRIINFTRGGLLFLRTTLQSLAAPTQAAVANLATLNLQQSAATRAAGSLARGLDRAGDGIANIGTFSSRAATKFRGFGASLAAAAGPIGVLLSLLPVLVQVGRRLADAFEKAADQMFGFADAANRIKAREEGLSDAIKLRTRLVDIQRDAIRKLVDAEGDVTEVVLEQRKLQARVQAEAAEFAVKDLRRVRDRQQLILRTLKATEALSKVGGAPVVSPERVRQQELAVQSLEQQIQLFEEGARTSRKLANGGKEVAGSLEAIAEEARGITVGPLPTDAELAKSVANQDKLTDAAGKGARNRTKIAEEEADKKKEIEEGSLEDFVKTQLDGFDAAIEAFQKFTEESEKVGDRVLQKKFRDNAKEAEDTRKANENRISDFEKAQEELKRIEQGAADKAKKETEDRAVTIRPVVGAFVTEGFAGALSALAQQLENEFAEAAANAFARGDIGEGLAFAFAARLINVTREAAAIFIDAGAEVAQAVLGIGVALGEELIGVATGLGEAIIGAGEVLADNLISVATGVAGILVGAGERLASEFVALVRLAGEFGAEGPEAFRGALVERADEADTFIQGLLQNLPVLFNALGDFIEPAIARLTEALPQLVDTFAQNLPGLVENLAAELPDLIGTIVDELPQIGATLADVLVTAVPTFVESFGALLPAVIETLVAEAPRIIDTLASAAPDIINTLAQGVPVLLNSVIANLPQVLNVIASQLPQIGNSLVTAITTAIPAFTASFTSLLPVVIDTLVREAPRVIEALTAAIPRLIRSLPVLVTGFVQLLPQITDALVGQLPGIVDLFLEELPRIITSFVDLFVTAFPVVTQELTRAFVGALPVIIDGFVQSIPVLVQSLAGSVGPIIDAIIDQIPDIVEAILEQLPLIIETLLEDLIAKAPELALAIVTGFIDGFIANIDKFIASLVAGIVKGIREAFEGVFRGLFSPKSVFGSIGGLFGFEKGGVVPGPDAKIPSFQGGGIIGRGAGAVDQITEAIRDGGVPVIAHPGEVIFPADVANPLLRGLVGESQRQSRAATSGSRQPSGARVTEGAGFQASRFATALINEIPKIVEAFAESFRALAPQFGQTLQGISPGTIGDIGGVRGELPGLVEDLRNVTAGLSEVGTAQEQAINTLRDLNIPINPASLDQLSDRIRESLPAPPPPAPSVVVVQSDEAEEEVDTQPSQPSSGRRRRPPGKFRLGGIVPDLPRFETGGLVPEFNLGGLIPKFQGGGIVDQGNMLQDIIQGIREGAVPVLAHPGEAIFPADVTDRLIEGLSANRGGAAPAQGGGDTTVQVNFNARTGDALLLQKLVGEMFTAEVRRQGVTDVRTPAQVARRRFAAMPTSSGVIAR